MTPMKTDVSVLAKEAANFERIAAELKSAVARVESTTESLAGHWRGGAGDAIRAALTKYHETAQHEFKQLDDISAKLQAAGAQYSSTDENQASSLAKSMEMGNWATGTTHGGGAPGGGGHSGGGHSGGGHSGGTSGSGSGSGLNIPGGGFTGNHPEWSGTHVQAASAGGGTSVPRPVSTGGGAGPGPGVRDPAGGTTGGIKPGSGAGPGNLPPSNGPAPITPRTNPGPGAPIAYEGAPPNPEVKTQST